MDKKTIEQKISAIEKQMQASDFWSDKDSAQQTIKEYNELKESLSGVDMFDNGSALVTIFSGAGGLDSEDFAGMLYRMYDAYAGQRGWETRTVHRHDNDHEGIKNITFEISGKKVYGDLKNESGVHRLVRISPFNAAKQRHTSFAMVEVIPKLPKAENLDIPDNELSFDTSKSGGPGGQNVNKRETAVRIVHTPTGIAVHADGERSQQANREKAMEILRGKLYHKREEDRKKIERGLSVSATTDAEWGNQIRSYVLHPYQMVKDHRTEVEVRDTKKVLEDGDLSQFIEAERTLGQ